MVDETQTKGSLLLPTTLLDKEPENRKKAQDKV